MRIGVSLGTETSPGVPYDAEHLTERARRLEGMGVDSIWKPDASFRGMRTEPDPLMWIMCAAAATTSVEVGTSVFQVPLRQPLDLAQRFMTLQALAPGRVTLGVGTGSTAAGHAAAGVAFEDRFRIFYEEMDTIRRFLAGERIGEAEIQPWAVTEGKTLRFALGAWGSEVSLRHAAGEFDGWICSAGGPHTAERGQNGVSATVAAASRYRELGGRRAILFGCRVDLSAPPSDLSPDEPFSLRCPIGQVADRLAYLEEIGFSDVILGVGDDEIEAVRAVVPTDTRRP